MQLFGWYDREKRNKMPRKVFLKNIPYFLIDKIENAGH